MQADRGHRRRKYLSDPSPDVKIATENVLADLLREIKHIARVQRQAHGAGTAPCADPAQHGYRRPSTALRRRASKLTMDTESSEMESVLTGTNTGTGTADDGGYASPDASVSRMSELKKEEDDGGFDPDASALQDGDEGYEEYEARATEHGAWIPGQGVFVDHAAIMDIMLQHVSYPGESQHVSPPECT